MLGLCASENTVLGPRTCRNHDITRPYTSTSYIQLVVTQKQFTSCDGISASFE